MLADSELPPYDGPFNAWLLQYAQGQVVVHAARVQEHQKQLSYHERQLRYWEQMKRLLSAGQGSTVPQPLPTPPLPNTAKQDTLGRAESKQHSKAPHSPPTSFRNPFIAQKQDDSLERDRIEREKLQRETQESARLAQEQQEEEERRLQEEQNALNENGGEYEAGPEFPTEEPHDLLTMEAEHAAREAEEALREAAEAEAAAAQAREEAERASAEQARLAEEEEMRQLEAEEEAKRQEEARRQKEAEEEAKRQQEEVDKQPLPEPEEDYPPHPTVTPAISAAIAPATATPHSPPLPAARKPPSTSPSLHADAAAVASTSIKERMARMGGLNPLAMMPVGPGMPMLRPKRAAEDGDQSSKGAAPDDSSHGRQDGLRSTQEMKPITVDPSKPSGEQAPKSPLVKGPAPPPRKPGGPASPASPQPTNPTPPAKQASAEAAKPVDSSHSSQSVTNSQSSMKPISSEAAKSAPLAAKKYCKANFDLDNPPKGCPKFKKGDFAECIEIKGEWSHVIFVKSGEEGHVPTAYFSMDVPLPTAPAAKKMKALFPFVPPKPKGFVPLKVGEIVTLEKGEIGEEWWVVKNAAGLSGYVPHNYVKAI